MILALFLTMKATIGQPLNCACLRDYGGAVLPTGYCNTRGCSNVTNRACYSGTYDGGPFDVIMYSTLYFFVPGPGAVGGHYYDGSYGPFVGYDYTNCTDYGGNARDDSGHVLPTARYATNCCNFCCGRNDSLPITTTTTITTTTSGSREIMLNKSLYLSGLTMLVLTVLKIY